MNIYTLELARIPNASLKILQRLAKTLLRDKPIQSNAVIDNATTDLKDQIKLVDEALTARLIANNPEFQTREVEFDYAVDGLWIFLRRELEGKEAYAHAGLDALPPALAEQANLAKLRDEAKRAWRLWNRLFAAEGTLFTKSNFIVQAESMAALLRMLDQEGLREELEAVVGPGLPRLIEVCQSHYESMVADRLTRERGFGQNLNEIRGDLRWALVAYINAVHSLYKRSAPETGKLVLDALRAVITVRESLAVASSEADADLDGLVALDGEGELPEQAEPVEQAVG
jgi:hypothetical protein